MQINFKEEMMESLRPITDVALSNVTTLVDQLNRTVLKNKVEAVHAQVLKIPDRVNGFK